MSSEEQNFRRLRTEVLLTVTVLALSLMGVDRQAMGESPLRTATTPSVAKGEPPFLSGKTALAVGAGAAAFLLALLAGSWVWSKILRARAASRIAALERELAERKQAGAAAQESDDRYRCIVEALPNGVASCDMDGTIRFSSPAHARMLGCRPEQVVGTKIWDWVVQDDARESVSSLLERALAERPAPADFVVPVRTRDGRDFLARVDWDLQYGPDGRVAGFVAAIADVTQQAGDEEALRRSQRELHAYAAALEFANQALEEFSRTAAAATRAKSEFLANMSHEIRTPMTAILGFTDVLLGTVTSPDAVEAVRVVQRNAEHLLELINEILDLSKIEAGMLQAQKSPCSPEQVLADVVGLLRVPAQAKGLPITVERASPIPMSIVTDSGRLRQILVNLVGNAVKFTERGSIRIVARFLRNDRGASMMQFEVVDTGIGMSEEQLAGLFRPFHQGDPAASRAFGGTGLGLCISKRLAELLGGDIEVASAPGKGSVFRLTVQAEPAGSLDLFQSPAETAGTPRPSRPASGSPQLRLDCRILVAEDGPDNQRLIALLLRKAGAVVEIRGDGQAAVETALAADREGRPFDLVLMDMQMPVMDGYEATRTLRTAGHRGPIVALTAHAMKEDRAKCLAAGCDDYLTKPIDRVRLVETVHRLCCDSPQQADNPQACSAAP